jgi:hypothetical protein
MDLPRTRATPQPVEDCRSGYYGDKPLHEIEKNIARARVRPSAAIKALRTEWSFSRRAL